MIKVRITSQYKVPLRRQLPAEGRCWENCEFIFDEDDDSASQYDWLVVFDLLPAETFSYKCPSENTILIITEPFAAKLYHPSYTRQFGMVISPQESFAVEHPAVYRSHAGLSWFYGATYGDFMNSHEWKGRSMGFDDLAAMQPPPKSKILSTVCSQKRSRRKPDKYKSGVFHRHRLDFTNTLKRDLPQLDFFGRGSNPVADKAEAIDDYKYHLAIENYSCDNYWTEKIADTYLGYALPIYYGCPNIAQYFPSESFIHIDIYDYPAALRRIKEAISNNEWEKRLPAIKEARKRLLHEHNLFALLARVVNGGNRAGGKMGGVIEDDNVSFRPWLNKRLRPHKIMPYWQRKRLMWKRRRYLKRKLAALGDSVYMGQPRGTYELS